MNTWVVTPLNSLERIAQFRSGDFDPYALYERYGEVAVYDLTDDMEPIGYVFHDGSKIKFDPF